MRNITLCKEVLQTREVTRRAPRFMSTSRLSSKWLALTEMKHGRRYMYLLLSLLLSCICYSGFSWGSRKHMTAYSALRSMCLQWPEGYAPTKSTEMFLECHAILSRRPHVVTATIWRVCSWEPDEFYIFNTKMRQKLLYASLEHEMALRKLQSNLFLQETYAFW